MREPSDIVLPDEHEDPYQILAMPSLTLAGSRVLKQGDTFAVFDRGGDIRPFGMLRAEGLYHEGARFLSSLRLRLERHPMLLLSSTVRENNVVLAVDLMNPDLHRPDAPAVPHGTVHVFRSKFLWHGTYYENLHVANYGQTAVDLWLELEFGADFVDVFEVRGTLRERHGKLHPPRSDRQGVVLSYTGLDGELRRTHLRFAPTPDVQHHGHAAYRIQLQARQTRDIRLTVDCETARSSTSAFVPFDAAYEQATTAVRRHEYRDSRVYTSHEQFNAWLNRSVADLQMLLTDTEHGPYPYAGVPWFSTPFGRDALLTALQMLWISPEIARGVLGFLAAEQATTSDPEADATPGKILHEMRDGEMARLGEVPFGRYYGSVDSTPLFVILACAHFESTGDGELARKLWPHVERAIEWIDRFGDDDGDGFVEYGRCSSHGLVQQGWKDSVDSVFHADGSLAKPPIALCEVQGYVYAAKQAAGRLASALGQAARGGQLEREAEQLRARFDEAFWCDEISSYALALDGDKRQCRVRSSNAGQCLWSGIVPPERAGRLADELLSIDMFSGWGVRTLAATEQRYNPMSYHNGSVWPHDNALIAAGLAAYGYKDHALRIFSALFQASLFFEPMRLPELFCGFPRRSGEGPTQYPGACAPQAWASAAPFLLLRAVLGLQLEGRARRLRFDNPVLPNFLNEVQIYNLRVGSTAVDLRLQRHPDDVGIHVSGRRGPIEVLALK